MRRFNRITCVISLISLGLSGAVTTASAQEATSGTVEASDHGTLTLDEAIRLGLTRNPGLAAARAGADAAEAGVREAETGYWPRIGLEAGARRSDNQVTVFSDKLTSGMFTADDFALDSLNNPDPVSHTSAAVSLELPLYTAGRIRHGVDAAAGQSSASRSRVRAAEADLTAAITESYFGIALAREAVRVAETAVIDAQGHEQVAAARYEAGSALRSDLLRAQVQRLSRERDLARRRGDLDIARARLRRLIAAAPDEPVDPATPLEQPDAPLGDQAAWIERALSTRPEIETARHETGAARAAAGVAHAAIGPEVAALARYERNADGFDWGAGSYLVGVGIRWTAFDRGRYSRNEAAVARVRAAEAAEQAVGDTVALEVQQAWLDARVADSSLAVAREAVGAAEAARRITADRYGGGLLPLTDLLNVETELVSARLGELSALYDTIVGRVRLSRAAGALEESR